jgi:tRNA nucleotidyltransferase (CCA-adding enzyme)
VDTLTDALGTVTDLKYLPDGNVGTITQGSGAEARGTSFSYTAEGLVDSITDPEGREVDFDYDAVGRVVRQSFPDLRSVSFAYDEAGNLTSLTPPGRPSCMTGSFACGPDVPEASTHEKGVLTPVCLPEHERRHGASRSMWSKLQPVLPPAVEETVRRLRASGIPAWIVGGALRDLLAHRETRDFDVLVEGSLEQAARALPEAVRIGGRTPVLVLAAREDRPRIEILEPRSPGGGLEGDLALRDFTLNAVAFDPVEGRWIDPLDGRRHLEERRLVAVDPRDGLRRDALRVLRGVRLAVDLELSIDGPTERAMERDSWRLVQAPGERLREEIFRILTLPRVSSAILLMRRVGALAAVLPELERTVGVAQNRWHLEDVYRHSVRVADGLRPDPLLRLAALLHDVAKPETKAYVARRRDFSFLRHELLARPHIARVAARLRLSRREHATVAALVRHHLIFPERLETDRAIRRMLARVGDDILPRLLELRAADLCSRGVPLSAPHGWQELVERIETLRAKERAARGGRLRLSGGDVMRVLGISEGPEVGRWLARARRRALEHPEENDRRRLIAWLRASAGEKEREGCIRT